MVMSSITVKGVVPDLSILGNFQRFDFSERESSFELKNNFVPTATLSSVTNFKIKNNSLSGFMWSHVTNSTDTFGSLKLQSFINDTSLTDVLVFPSSGGLSVSGNINFQGFKATNLADGTQNTDAATFGQVKSIIATNMVTSSTPTSVDSNIVIFSSTTGKIIKESGVGISSVAQGAISTAKTSESVGPVGYRDPWALSSSVAFSTSVGATI
jgi:hypothetical protein